MAGSQISPVLETWAFGTHMARGHSHYADSPSGAAFVSSSSAATAAAANFAVDDTVAYADYAASSLASPHPPNRP